jgi:hypothetical protein
MKHSINNSQALQEASDEFQNDRSELVERLWESKYAKPEYAGVALGIDEVYDNPLTKRRAVNTIIKMDNQERYFGNLSKYLGEDTFTANFGATPAAIIRSIRVANPNSVIEDICDVQTVSSMVGIIGYIKPVFSRSIRGGVAGDLLVESKAKDYAAENLDENIGTGDGIATVFAAELSYSPIRPGKVTILVAGLEVGVDDGKGNIVNVSGGSAITEAGSTVDYTLTGANNISVTFAAAVADQDAVVVNYNYDTEQNTGAHGDVEILWNSEPVSMEMHPLNFKFSLTSMLLAESANFSVEEVLNDAATQYLKSERDRRGVEFNTRLALSNPTTTFDAGLSGGENNHKMRAQLLELAIESASDAMYEAKNRGGVSFIIAGSKVATYANLLDNYTKDNSHSPIGAYRVGYLGKAPVIKARVNTLATDELLVGYRSEWGESPFVHADYLDYATESLTLKDFITQKGLASYYQNKKVEPSFIRKVKVDNIPA